jgi:AraC-like DNA-binding protein/mannose-6-phosphate isomerase-like protein (cupin superfamily)
MKREHETIQLAPDETFRLLRWRRSVNRVEVLRGGRATPLSGSGGHWHYHRAMELTLIERGGGTRFVADHIEMFQPGDLVLIGPSVPHYWHTREHCAGFALQWDFPLDHGVWSLGEAAAPLRSLTKSALHGIHLRGRTAAAVSQAMTALAPMEDFARLAAFFQLLSMLCAAPAGDLRPLAQRPFALDSTAEQQEAVRRAVSYVMAHHREPIRLEALHQLTGMSRATFARQFRRHSGKSFSAFLNQVRLQAVCRALRETADSVSTIAFNHGFNQLSFFNRLFRRELGQSPVVWRQNAAAGCSGGISTEAQTVSASDA